MPDREKVIKGLQESAAYFRSSFDAMYGTVACEKFRSWTDAIEQATVLLKAQEPRVMAPDEVKNAPEKSVIWLELKPDEIFKEEIYPFVGSGTGWYSCYCSANTAPMFTDDDVEQYGVEFRCWTSRPTDEQKEATAWMT